MPDRRLSGLNTTLLSNRGLFTGRCSWVANRVSTKTTSTYSTSTSNSEHPFNYSDYNTFFWRIRLLTVSYPVFERHLKEVFGDVPSWEHVTHVYTYAKWIATRVVDYQELDWTLLKRVADFVGTYVESNLLVFIESHGNWVTHASLHPPIEKSPLKMELCPRACDDVVDSFELINIQ